MAPVSKRSESVLIFLFLTLLAACSTTMHATTDWYDFTAPDGSFRISFPEGAPVSRQVTVGNVPRTDYIHYENGNTFTVEVFESKQYSIDRAEKIFRDYPN